LGANGAPEGWDLAPGVSQVAEGGNRFLRFVNDSHDRAVALTRIVALPAGSKAVVVSARMRAARLELGREGWHEARIALRFENDKKEMVGGYPAMPALRTPSPDWLTREVVLDVPEGATRLVLQPGLWLAKGTLDLDDVRVVPYPTGGEYLRERAAAAAPLNAGAATRLLDKPAGWNLPGRGQAIVISGGKTVLRVTNPSPDGNVAATTVVALNPDWASVKVALSAGVDQFRPGTDGWKAARVLAQFLDENGKQLSETTLAQFGADTPSLQAFTTDANLPAGARFLRLSAGWDRAAGILDVADLQVTPQAAAPLADAKLPESVKLGWGEEPVTAVSPTRAAVSLNGCGAFCRPRTRPRAATRKPAGDISAFPATGRTTPTSSRAGRAACGKRSVATALHRPGTSARLRSRGVGGPRRAARRGPRQHGCGRVRGRQGGRADRLARRHARHYRPGHARPRGQSAAARHCHG
jgi:hypothetical protein